MGKIKENLVNTLQAEHIKQEDPRALGKADIFDTYYYMGFGAMRKMYGDRFKIPDHLKKYEFSTGGKVD